MVDTSPSHPGFERSSPDEDIGVEAKNEAKISDHTSRADSTYARTEQTPPQTYHGHYFETNIHDSFEHPHHHHRTGAITVPICDLSTLRTPRCLLFPSTPATSRYPAGDCSASLPTSQNNEWMPPTFTITAPYCATEIIPRMFEEETPLLRSATPDPELLMPLVIDSAVEVRNVEQIEAHIVSKSGAIAKPLKKAICLDTPKLPQQPFVSTPDPSMIVSEAEDCDEYDVTFVDVPDCVFEPAPSVEASGEDMMVDLEYARYANTSIPAGTHNATDYAMGSSKDKNTDANTDSDASIFNLDSSYGSSASSCTSFESNSDASAIHPFKKYPNLDSLTSPPQDPIAPVLTTTHADGAREYIPSDAILLAEAQETVCGINYAILSMISEALSQDDHPDSGYASGCNPDVSEFNLASQYPDVLDEPSSDEEDGWRSGNESSDSDGDGVPAYTDTAASPVEHSVYRPNRDQGDRSLEPGSLDDGMLMIAEEQQEINTIELFCPVWSSAGVLLRIDAEKFGLLNPALWWTRATDDVRPNAIHLSGRHGAREGDTVLFMFNDAERKGDKNTYQKEENTNWQSLAVLDNKSESNASWYPGLIRVAVNPDGFAFDGLGGSLMGVDIDFPYRLLSWPWRLNTHSLDQNDNETRLPTDDDEDQVIDRGVSALINKPHDHKKPQQSCQTIQWIHEFAGLTGMPRHLPRRVHQLRGEWRGHSNNVDEGQQLNWQRLETLQTWSMKFK